MHNIKFLERISNNNQTIINIHAFTDDIIMDDEQELFK